MEFKSHAQLLYDFLKKYEIIFNHEVMDYYPQSLSWYNAEWMNSLATLSEEKLYQFDCRYPLKELEQTSLNHFVETIKKLTQVKMIETTPDQLEDWALIDVKHKKQHEILNLAPYLKNLKENVPFENIIDIGGGVGHLSRVLALYYQIDTVTIDTNKEFQESGKKRLQKYRHPIGAKNITFLNLTFGDQIDSKILNQYFNHHTLTIGLHTCGPLANHLINTTLKYQNIGLLNFGCCYHKLKDQNDFPISQYFKKNFDIKLHQHAMTLASRAHGPISYEDFQTKLSVKNYRQGLHLFLIEKLNIKDCFDVGEIHVREYKKPFAEYVIGRLNSLNIPHQETKESIDLFFQQARIQKILREMFLASLIRWQLGRALELYILLDRAIYLEENNYSVQMLQFFNEAISPRNIGILAIKQ